MAWSEIKHALNSTLGTNNFKPLDKYMSTGGNIKCIKSVQRGSVTIPAGSSAEAVTISSITMTKAFLNFSYNTDEYQPASHTPYGYISSTRQITFARRETEGNIYIRWEVIEFY